MAQLGTPEKPARCPDGDLLIEGWGDTDLWEKWLEQRRRRRSAIPMPADIYRCPPCARGDAVPWLVTAGTQHAVVYAGCETAAREAIISRLRRYHRANRVTARAATPADVARWHQMLAQQEAR